MLTVARSISFRLDYDNQIAGINLGSSTKKGLMHLILGLVILLSLHGCAMYTSPGIYLADRSARKEIAEQAKGAGQVQTLRNLKTVMENRVKSAVNGKGCDQPFSDLHT